MKHVYVSICVITQWEEKRGEWEQEGSMWPLHRKAVDEGDLCVCPGKLDWQDCSEENPFSTKLVVQYKQWNN